MKTCILVALVAACSVPDHDYTMATDAAPDVTVDASPSMISASPAGDIALGDVVMGQTTAKTTVTISNDGGTESGPIKLAFDNTAEGFAIVEDGCTGTALAPLHTCTFAVVLTPAHVGEAAVALQIDAMPGGSLAKQVGGKGITQGQLDIIEASYDFTSLGIDAVGLTKVFTVRNIGQAMTGVPSASTAAGDASYTVDMTTCSAALAPAATCTVKVRFDPSSVGQKAGSLTMTATPGGQDVATLAGTGTAHVGVVTTGTGSGVVRATQGGIECGQTCDADFAASPVTLEAQAHAGSTFTGWGVDCSGTGTCTLNLTGAKSATASFSINYYPLTITRSGNGSGTASLSNAGNPCGTGCTSYPYQTTVTLTPTASVGSSFTGWSGDCAGQTSCMVTMDQARNVTASFTLDTHDLTLAKLGSGSGSVKADIGSLDCGATCAASYDHGTTVTLTATPAVGSTFAGWTGCASTTGTSCTVSMTADRPVTAKFDLGSFLLTAAKTGNGTVASSDGNIICGPAAGCTHAYVFDASITLTATPSNGQHFVQWSTGPCASSAVATCTFKMPAAATTSTAVFAIDRYALGVTVDGTGQGSVSSAPAGISCPGTCSMLADFDSTVTLTATPMSGSSASWSGCDSTSGNNCSVKMTTARNVTATFSAGPQMLSVATAGNATGAVVSTPIGISCPGSCSASFAFGTSVTLSATPQGAATFAGWSGDCSGMTCTLNMNQPHSVIATFSGGDQTLTLTKSGAGGGSFMLSPLPLTTNGTMYTYGFGANVTITATANSTSTFTGWSGACAGQANPCTVLMDRARSVDATFTPVVKRLTLALASPNGGTGNATPSPLGAPCGTRCWDYAYGTTVVVTASPDVGSSFDSWSSCMGTGTCTVTMNADTSVTATFVKNYTLSVTTLGDGSGTVAATPGGLSNTISCATGSATNCSATYAGVTPPTSVTITPTAASGSVFDGWLGDCTGSATCSVSMNASHTVSARFTKIYGLTATATAGGTLSVTAGQGSCGANCTQYLSGTVVTITAQPTGGYYFAGWSGDCASQGTTCSLTMSANHATTANFAPFNALNVTVVGGGRVTSSDGRIDCGSTCGATYAPAPMITLTAAPFPGSIFNGWSGACTGAGTTCTVTMSQAQSVTAKFYYMVNFGVNGSGSISTSTTGGMTCTPTSGYSQCLAFAPGTPVVVQYTQGVGNSFAGWDGGTCSGTGACAPVVNGAVNVIAKFTPNNYTLFVNMQNNNPASNQISGSMFCASSQCTGTFAYGTTVSLIAAPDFNTGRFTAWTSGPCTGSTNPNCVFPMPASSIGVTAQFDWFATMRILPNAGGAGGSTLAAKAVATNINCTNTTTSTGTCTAGYARNASVTIEYSAGASWSFCQAFPEEPPMSIESTGYGNCAPAGGTLTPTTKRTCTFTFGSPGDYTSGFNVWCLGN